MKPPWKRQFWVQWWAHLRPILGLIEEDKMTEIRQEQPPQTPEPEEEPSHPMTIPEKSVDVEEEENSDPETETGP